MNIAATDREVRQQLDAMGCARVDLGALHQSGYMTLAANYRTRLIRSALRWLRHANARGANIFVRPAGIHQLSLIDDLTAAAIEEMKRTGFGPAVVVETSPRNFQVWLRHGRTLDQRMGTRAAQELARRFGGDPSGAAWRHFGRLAGFTNRKPKRRLPNGLPPFARLREAAGQVYSQAEAFLAAIAAQVEQESAERTKRYEGATHSNHILIKDLRAFYRDARYGGDLHRADLAWAIYAASRGLSEQAIRDEILDTRDLTKKGGVPRQLAYAERTAFKAVTIVQTGR